ncbi:MAG: HEAT repeat domain-containing protein [Candidatus Riflebacteria bacterium]|nr:HEAT repeat domain-containing protein [Candidatus Riflebacteria bacterium]
MDDYSFNLTCLDSADTDRQLAGLAYFAACDDHLLTDEATNKLIYLAENGQRHVSDIATSIISQTVGRREQTALKQLMLKKLQKGNESQVTLRDLDLCGKLQTKELKIALEDYLERCFEPNHISWLVKNLPKFYPDPEQFALLKSFLAYGDDRIVSNAIEGIEVLNIPDNVSLFSRMLSHASPRVRSVAAEAIARISPETARKALTDMLNRPEQVESVKAACYAIRHLPDHEFLDLALPLLSNRKVRDEAAKTVASLALKKILSLFDHEVFSKHAELRARVASSIIELLREQCNVRFFPSSDSDDIEQGACQLTTGETGVFAYSPLITPDQAKKIAENNKKSGIGFFLRLIYRPKPEEIQLTFCEQRLQPFWHIECEASLDYIRSRPLTLDLEDQVCELKIGDQLFKPAKKRVDVTVEERCMIKQSLNRFIDATTGAQADFSEIISKGKAKPVSINETVQDGFKIIPARIRASILVRNIIFEFMKPLKALEILAQGLNIAKLNLYLRPVYVFEFNWIGRDQKVAFEIDGVTGKISEGHNIPDKGSEMISESSLFDIGADALGLVVPGGEIAAKLAAAFLGKKR